LEIIAAILETLDVDNWEALPGTFIRVKNENFGPILGIGHLIRDQWFSFERFFKSRKPEIWSTYRQQDFIEEDEHRP
jgi:hypothetical protein